MKYDITWKEVEQKGLKVVKSRWVDTRKALPDDPRGVRSRIVAQELNLGPRDDTFAGTPPLWVHRLVVSSAATRRKGDHGNRRIVGRYDVSVAFFHALSTGGIAVLPPKDTFDGEHLWFLLKAMNGTREASRQWGLFIKSALTPAGFLSSAAIPGLYYHPEWDITLACHCDDFLAEGLSQDLDKLDDLMKEKFEVKVLPRIGDPEHGGEASEGAHLHRIIKWTSNGFTWEADPKYAGQLVKDMGLESSKSVDTPASKETGKNERHVNDPLPETEAREFRKLAGTALYLSLDRPTIQFAVSQIATGMAKPTYMHMFQLKRLGRHLLKYPTEIWVFELQDEPSTFFVYSDSDWATCKSSRKSMSAYSLRYGKHLLDTSCARQSVVALSSGEAEYYALTRGACAGVLLKGVLSELRRKVEMVCLTDSSAAKGITARKGVGKVKHLSLRELWVQDAVQEKRFKVQKESTTSNWSDLGTKILDGSRITELLNLMPLKRGIIAASLLAVAKCQGETQEDEPDGFAFWLYLLLVHIFALFGLFRFCVNVFDWFQNEPDDPTSQMDMTGDSDAEVLTSVVPSEAAGSSLGIEQTTCSSTEGVNSSVSITHAMNHEPKLQIHQRRTAEGEDVDVYAIGTGQRYHTAFCGMVQAKQNRHRVRRLRRSTAIANGLTPCKQCNPR